RAAGQDRARVPPPYRTVLHCGRAACYLHAVFAPSTTLNGCGGPLVMASSQAGKCESLVNTSRCDLPFSPELGVRPHAPNSGSTHDAPTSTYLRRLALATP